MVKKAVREVAVERKRKVAGVDNAEQIEQDLTNRERTVIYHAITGEPREVLEIDVPRLLRKEFADGTPMFWAEGLDGKPPPYKRGEIMCYLHPEHPEREWIDSIGLNNRTCNMGNPDKPNKETLPSTFDLEAHMARAHRTEWTTIKNAREEQYRQEERDFRRAMLEQANS